MKIQYCSDLHLEFLDNKRFILENPIVPSAEILILAGDVVPFRAIQEHNYFFDFLSENFKHTFWIPGNHEYYYSDIRYRSGVFEEKIRNNVTLLNNCEKTVDGVRFVFSTLWARISQEKKAIIQQSLSDFYVIENKNNALSVKDFNQLNAKAIKFLEASFENESILPTVMVTHHPPTFINYPEKYANSPINEAFGCEMLGFINKHRIDYWIYGHHHFNVEEFTIGKTKLITNQLGYVKYFENEGFKTDCIISFD